MGVFGKDINTDSGTFPVLISRDNVEKLVSGWRQLVPALNCVRGRIIVPIRDARAVAPIYEGILLVHLRNCSLTANIFVLL